MFTEEAISFYETDRVRGRKKKPPPPHQPKASGGHLDIPLLFIGVFIGTQ